MPLTKIQQGVIGQSEAAKLMMMGSGGRLEVAMPLSDDERRDEEIHTRGQFGRALALQVKTTMRLIREGASLRVSFISNVETKRLISDPMFWYLFAYLDRKTMAFGDPIFLVDSATLHARLNRREGSTNLVFHASISPNSHDRWVPYRVHPADLGTRIVHVLDTPGRLSKPRMSGITEQAPDLIWVGTRQAAG
jgi:hypothetical protein